MCAYKQTYWYCKSFLGNISIGIGPRDQVCVRWGHVEMSIRYAAYDRRIYECISGLQERFTTNCQHIILTTGLHRNTKLHTDEVLLQEAVAFTTTTTKQPPRRTAVRLISISRMCLCTFISTSDWHFHRNYWANQLTGDGSGLACSLSLGNISFSCFFLFFNVSAGNNGTSAEIRVHLLM